MRHQLVQRSPGILLCVSHLQILYQKPFRMMSLGFFGIVNDREFKKIRNLIEYEKINSHYIQIIIISDTVKLTFPVVGVVD